MKGLREWARGRGAARGSESLLGDACRAMAFALDAWRFRRERRRYYEYLSALLQGSRGALTLKQIFAADAHRHGDRTPRGRLSRRWLSLFQTAGGDLHATWAGVFPAQELALLRSAQERGNDALVETFLELSRALKVVESGRNILLASVLAAAFAFIVLLATLMAVPRFTVPRLRESFASLPPEYHGMAMRRLQTLAETVDHAWPWMLPLMLVLAWLVLASFRNWTGPLRKVFDSWGPWRIYRQVQAMRFLALLSVALGRGEHGATRLRRAMELQCAGASPWLEWHVLDMLLHVDAGLRGGEVFNTGLLERQHLWFLDDMLRARGMVEGLRLCSAWVEEQVLDTVARQAATLRWCLLLGAVCGLLAIALWHYAALDDLRRGLALFHASQ